MKKPVYKHPDFIVDKNYHRTDKKRFWLELTINKDRTENIIVIMKNPSRATLEVSDKTVFNVCNYIFKNKNDREELKNVGKIIILNLIPFYETYSKELFALKEEIIDPANLNVIKNYSSKNSRVIIAWGNHPSKLFKEYEMLKKEVFQILKENNNDVYYVGSLSGVGNPKHAQVWGYENKLFKLTIK
ncbi:DUF1643 domain-containing protein [Flavobacterium sp. WC2421]|uniref:DUF1643 domain-containing protein n=1 Tax=Flavobacterium sp. WC2421 TaxID=3234138 RepID=UPI003466B6FD